MAAEDELETPEQVARRIKRSENWLAKARCGGFGPPFLKIGSAVRYRRSDVDAWLRECTRTSTAGRALLAA